MIKSWMPMVLGIELKKFLTYRFEFWAQLLGSIAIHLVTAYFLWAAVFLSTGKSEIGGFSFPVLMFYYLLVPFFENMTVNQSNNASFVSDEIYDGSLTRYLIYPLSVLTYKYVASLSNFIVGIVQLSIVLVVVKVFIGFPTDVSLSPANTGMAFLSLAMGSYLFFCILCFIETVAFWADNVWSLKVMFRFAVGILGGALLPLSLYPTWAQKLIQFLPFQHIFYVPIRTFMGDYPFEGWLVSISIGIFWCSLVTFGLRAFWKRGLLQYSGVGI